MDWTDLRRECPVTKRWACFDHAAVRRPGEASGIVSVVVSGNLWEVRQRCLEAGIVVNQRGGRLCVSPHAYNSSEELDRLVGLLGALS